ncbi:MAG: hypothetical protein WCC04_22250 [Terriglobales bacterium]
MKVISRAGAKNGKTDFSSSRAWFYQRKPSGSGMAAHKRDSALALDAARPALAIGALGKRL